MTIIERLNNKKTELEKRLTKQYQGGSQRKENLEYKIEKIEELITVYQANSSPTSLAEAEEIFKQQVGFQEQKRRILEQIEIEKVKKQNDIKSNTLILCFVGPPGVGKTTFAQLLAQALKKEFFSLALGGLTDASVLVGASESSSGNEIGQLARALVETKTYEPVILLDEIDKLGSSFKNPLHDCLINILDPEQNHEVLDYYLDVKLDFSQVTFVVTANEFAKIPTSLRSRMLMVEIFPYNIEQKKEITQKIIQEWFIQNKKLSKIEIILKDDSLETLINKTQEKGVRQLKMALDIIFDYSLFQYSRAKTTDKFVINIDSDLINQIIPSFPNIDQEENESKENKNYKAKQIELVKIEEQVNNLEEKLNNYIKGILWFFLFAISTMMIVICRIFSKLEKYKKIM